MNIPQGDSSFIAGAVDFSARLSEDAASDVEAGPVADAAVVGAAGGAIAGAGLAVVG
jgi:hypothetical protein